MSDSAPLPLTPDDLFREEVARARAMTDAEKIRAGPELFAYACEIARAGIRGQFPGADAARVEEILRARLALAERMEEGD